MGEEDTLRVARALDEQITGELVGQMTSRGRPGALAAMAVTCAFALLIHDVFAHELVLSWVAFSLFASFWRLWQSLRLQWYGRSPAPWTCVLVGAASGLVWGLAGTSFVPTLTAGQSSASLGFLVAALLTGMPAGAIASLGYYFPAYLAYVLLSIVPFALINITSGHSELVLTGACSFVYATFMLRMSHANTRASRQAIVQRLALSELTDSLTKARDAAESASRAKSAFLANMSHEIRTPLNAVIGISELMQDVSDKPKARDYAQTIRRSAKSLLGVINDVLDLSRIEAGGLSLRPERFDLQQLLHEVIDMFVSVAQGKGLKLVLDIGAAVPRAVHADPVRLRQILVNLVGNAMKFTPSGTVTLRASAISATAESVRLCLEVQDSGVGISPDDCARLFKPFSQVGETHGGTGLGLAITADLVALMDGVIEVSSAPGEGSCFRVWLTFLLDDDAALAAAPPVATGPLGYPVHVLVVEDNAVNQLVTTEMLDTLGCTVAVAGSGTAALAMMEDATFDFVLMDCQMPGVDGYETTRRWRDQETRLGRQRTPVVALTASSISSDRDRCFDAGMDDYLSKPVSRDQIREAITRWVPPPSVAAV